MRGLWSLAGLMVFVGTLTGCPRHGMIDDGTSVSQGPANGGRLLNPALLPRHGDGFWRPDRWHHRGLRYGTDELVSVVAHVGRRLHRERPGTVIGVADLSPRRGGRSAWHRSHQSGRDVDFLLLATDAAGKPIQLDTMVKFDSAGIAYWPKGSGETQTALVAKPAQEHQGPKSTHKPMGREIHFDLDRNWLLIRALLENPIAEVQYIFIANHLKHRLIEHAYSIGESEAVIVHASHLLIQPSMASPHDDHIHVRIFCAVNDRDFGCRDQGRVRWVKKHYKYSPLGRRFAAQNADMDSVDQSGQHLIAQMLSTPMPAMLVLGNFPFRP